MKILSLITLGNGVKMTFEVKHTLSSSLYSQASLAEGFVEPLENRRFSDQASAAKQNLDSLPLATFGCSVEDPSGPLTRISKLRKGNPTTNDPLPNSSGGLRPPTELVVGGVNASLPSWAPQGTVEPIPIFIPEPHKENRLWFEMDEPADKEMRVTVYEVPKDAPIFIDTSKGKQNTFHQSGLRYPHMLLPGTYIFTFSNDQYTQLSVVFENNKLSIGEY